IGADTVVFESGEILGKPKSQEEAKKMLKRLSGRTHSVVTGYAVITKDEIISGSVTTEVTFNNLSDELISKYIESGLYKGKAGSYGIQDPFPLVKSYKGSLTNVIGLPIETIVPILEKIVK
ncbi:MAG: Maf-like protein, partial [Clostridiales bacterium]|nr:Maf-like protein [Clostridiales bacterium]